MLYIKKQTPLPNGRLSVNYNKKALLKNKTIHDSQFFLKYILIIYHNVFNVNIIFREMKKAAPFNDAAGVLRHENDVASIHLLH